MDWDQPIPRLRHVETFPVEMEGQAMLAIKDPQRYATATLTVARGVVFVLAACDGNTSFADLAEAYKDQTGGELPHDDIKKMLRTFDDHFFFDNPRFQRHRDEVDRAWLSSPLRPSTIFDFTGQDPDGEARAHLEKLLDGFFRNAGFGRGSEIQAASDDAAALIAPHIDFMRGGPVWAAAYGEFARSFQGETVIILGTNHQPHQAPISLTRKNFATPFGPVEVDGELLDAVADRLPGDPFQEELTHRVEHSIELAAVMLAYLDRRIKIVPVLVGSAGGLLKGENERSDEALTALAAACRDILAEEGSRVALIASADLAHVGNIFGDPFRVDREKARINRERDLEMLAPLSAADPGAFVRYVAEEKDVRKICGLGPIYVAGEACGLPFKLLRHDQWVDDKGSGLVSFAALIARRIPG